MYLLNIMAVSLDGKISSHGGESDHERMTSGFINETDHELVELELQQADAVVIGADTLRASKRIWTIKNCKDIFPPWFIFTRRGFDPDLDFWNQNLVQRILVSPKLLEREDHWNKNVENIAYGDKKPASFLYRNLEGRGFKKVVLFGGGHINEMFYREGLVDGLQLTLAPMIVGKKHASSFVNPNLSANIDLKLESSQVSKNHVFLRYSVKNP
ncbi:MAG: RibD family protein [Oligoflexales bacterium]